MVAVDNTETASAVGTVVDKVVAATEAGSIAGVAWAGNYKALAVVATEQDIVIAVIVATVVDSASLVDRSHEPHEVGAVEVADTMRLAVAIVDCSFSLISTPNTIAKRHTNIPPQLSMKSIPLKRAKWLRYG